MSEENLETLMRGYEGFNRGDISGMREVEGRRLLPIWNGEPPGPFRGLMPCTEAPGRLGWMKVIRSEWEEFEVALDEVLHDGDDVLVVTELLRGRGRESGVEVEMRVFSAYSFENGKVRRRAAFTERKVALEAAGLEE